MEMNGTDTANQPTIDPRAAMNDAIVAAFFPFHREEDWEQLVLEGVYGGVGEEEHRHQYCTELECQLVEEQQQNARLMEELRLEKAHDMISSTSEEMAMAVDHQSAEMEEQSITSTIGHHQLNAAQQLRVTEDLQPVEEPPVQRTKKSLKVQRLHQAGQKVATQQRQKLKEKKSGDAPSEELASIICLDDVSEQSLNNDANDAASSPCDGDVNALANVVTGVFKCAQCPDHFTFASAQVLANHQRYRHQLKDNTHLLETTALAKGLQAELASDLVIWLDDDDQQSIDEASGAISPLCDGDDTVNVVTGVFKCLQCPDDRVAYSSVQLLTNHKRRFHTSRQHHRHQCQQCGWSSMHIALLKRHQRTHTGEKPFTCDWCGRGFALKSNLTTHSRQHTGERPYVCRVCEKAFIAQGSLIRHSRVHSGETPFSCRHCAKLFKDTSSCRQHEKICPKRPQSTAE